MTKRHTFQVSCFAVLEAPILSRKRGRSFYYLICLPRRAFEPVMLLSMAEMAVDYSPDADYSVTGERLPCSQNLASSLILNSCQ